MPIPLERPLHAMQRRPLIAAAVLAAAVALPVVAQTAPQGT